MAKVVFEKHRVFLPKLIGAFIAWFAVVMFVISCAQMYDVWDAVKHYPNRLAQIDTQDSDAYLRYTDCKDSLYNITGLQLRGDQAVITTRQFLVALLGPVAQILLWAIVFLFGMLLYQARMVKVSAAPVHSAKKRK